MRFALPFSQAYKDLSPEEVQWVINYKPQIEKLNNFIQAYKTYRIICRVPAVFSDKDLEIFKILTQKFPDTEIIAALGIFDKQVEKNLTYEHIKHYYDIPVNTWEDLAGFLNLNVTDILITEDLCFYLPIVKKKAKESNIILRTYCDICECKWDNVPSYKTFFIRPEDVDIYAKYIKVFEFYEKDPKRIQTLYSIYHDDKKWFGRLKEIIKNYKRDDDNKGLASIFAEKRINCNHKCLKGGPCKICDNLITLSNILNEKKLYITKEG